MLFNISLEWIAKAQFPPIFSLFWKKPKKSARCVLLQHFLEAGLPILHIQATLSNNFL